VALNILSKKGKTPVLSAADARLLLASIVGLTRTSETDDEEKVETSDVVRLRDRALIGVMVYSFAHVSAVIVLPREAFRVSRPSLCRMKVTSGWRRRVRISRVLCIDIIRCLPRAPRLGYSLIGSD
jgi:hypothetical protein